MSFRDWSDDDYLEFHDDAFTSIFNEIDGVHYLSESDYAQAEQLFEQGWLTFGEYSKEEIDVIRGDFFDLVGLYEGDFDWQEFQDLYAAAGG
jgi:hypothetical protein